MTERKHLSVQGNGSIRKHSRRGRARDREDVWGDLNCRELPMSSLKAPSNLIRFSWVREKMGRSMALLFQISEAFLRLLMFTSLRRSNILNSKHHAGKIGTSSSSQQTLVLCKLLVSSFEASLCLVFGFYLGPKESCIQYNLGSLVFLTFPWTLCSFIRLKNI